MREYDKFMPDTETIVIFTKANNNKKNKNDRTVKATPTTEHVNKSKMTNAALPSYIHTYIHTYV